MAKAKDLTGETFGRLRPQRIVGSSRYGVIWRCKCDCGGSVDAVSANLRAGKVRSCGCFSEEVHREIKTTHGLYGTKVRNVWGGMMQRCHNRNSKDWPRYGGRGIYVCDRWRDFLSFVEDMGHPGEMESIERIDNDGPYCPENCKWSTALEQARNRRPQSSVVAGVQWDARRKKWKVALSSKHLGYFPDWLDAVAARKSAEHHR